MHSFHFDFQVHSLTARSVSRQFREGLRKGMPDFSDRNIRLPTSSPDHQDHDIAFGESENNPTQLGAMMKIPAVSPQSNCTIIYDSQHNNNNNVRTASPEHVGIPAGPVKIPPARRRQSGNAAESVKPSADAGYTSDDSCNSVEKVKVVTRPARRRITRSSSNVRSLVERFANWYPCACINI